MAPQTTKKPSAKTTQAKTVAAYLQAAPKAKRASLMKLRKTIKAAAPKATEGISYGIVGFKHKGKRLVYFGHAKTHYALYGIGGGVIEAYAAQLTPYIGNKGTIRFPSDEPVPVQLVTKIVKARVAEIEGSR
jgi:uncharacterized protein YdhG (YjbR/CyaY superfamily)